jgi:hypothetical protein
MKTFAYLSILLLTAGAAFGIIDYTKAKKNGSFDKVYAEETTNETAPANIISPNSQEVIKETAVFENKTAPVLKKTPTPVPLKNYQSKSFSKTGAAKEKIIIQKAPSTEVKEEAPAAKPVKKEITKTPSRKLDLRDFGRGSLRQRVPKKN